MNTAGDFKVESENLGPRLMSDQLWDHINQWFSLRVGEGRLGNLSLRLTEGEPLDPHAHRSRRPVCSHRSLETNYSCH